MKKLLLCLIFSLAIFSLFAIPALAKIGVGVNTGKIQVSEKLKAGMTYRLPPITVINTGDETTEYETSISYHQNQVELRPQQSWFVFTPQKFRLDQGKTQLVEIRINLPVMVKPGNYFAYLEAHPLATVQKGGTTLGVAAAAKLYFTVEPANIFMGIYYKTASFWNLYSSWIQGLLVLVIIISVALIIKRNFNIQIGLKKPS